jgi:ABC-type sugar transport system permease subunit
MAPTISLFIAFSYYPFLKNALLAFSLTDKKGNFVKWIGFANFKRLLGKPTFWLVVKNTFQFAFIVAILTLGMIHNIIKIF